MIHERGMAVFAMVKRPLVVLFEKNGRKGATFDRSSALSNRDLIRRSPPLNAIELEIRLCKANMAGATAS